MLEIRVPEIEGGVGGRDLFAALLHAWPSLLAFCLSFFVVLVMWINHHEFLRWVRASDYPFLFANGFLLLLVTFIPFPTAVVARYLVTEAAQAAAAFYCGTFFLVSLAYGALFRSVAHRRRLVRAEVPDADIARVRRAYSLGPVVYAASTVLALWNGIAGLVLCASLWVLWTRLCYRSPAGGDAGGRREGMPSSGR